MFFQRVPASEPQEDIPQNEDAQNPVDPSEKYNGSQSGSDSDEVRDESWGWDVSRFYILYDWIDILPVSLRNPSRLYPCQ